MRRTQKQNATPPPPSIRLNSADTSSEGTKFKLLAQVADPGAAWTDNPSGKDVSVLSVNSSSLHHKKYELAFYPSDIRTAGTDKTRDLGVSAGDGVFDPGFPMDMAGAQRNYVIVRQGVIARIGEMPDKASDTSLIDSFVFPGNSGGPVVLRADPFAITGTKAQMNAMLIGMVIESVEYTDATVSQQTGRARISFEENSGLAVVIPTDYIAQIVLAAEGIEN